MFLLCMGLFSFSSVAGCMWEKEGVGKEPDQTAVTGKFITVFSPCQVTAT